MPFVPRAAGQGAASRADHAPLGSSAYGLTPWRGLEQIGNDKRYDSIWSDPARD
jgi:hypothetical protein